MRRGTPSLDRTYLFYRHEQIDLEGGLGPNTIVAVSTRKLVIAALTTAVVILAAFAVFLVQLSRANG